jgi:hypothetical protein
VAAVKLNGFATASMDVENVGDLRRFVEWCDRYKISDTAVVDANGPVYLELADSTLGAIVEMIQCGEHIPPDDGWDVLINTHKHDNVDRYGDEARPE